MCQEGISKVMPLTEGKMNFHILIQDVGTFCIIVQCEASCPPHRTTQSLVSMGKYILQKSGSMALISGSKKGIEKAISTQSQEIFSCLAT